MNERLAHTPELYLLALAQFAITADTEVVRALSLSQRYSLTFCRCAPSLSFSSAVSSSAPRPLMLRRQLTIPKSRMRQHSG